MKRHKRDQQIQLKSVETAVGMAVVSGAESKGVRRIRRVASTSVQVRGGVVAWGNVLKEEWKEGISLNSQTPLGAAISLTPPP